MPFRWDYARIGFLEKRHARLRRLARSAMIGSSGEPLADKKAHTRVDYQQTLDYLYSFPDSLRKMPRPPPEWNLPQTDLLLQAVGAPQRVFRSIVVAGTKGKGSTSAMLEAMLRAAGYRTGLWTSPHLHSYRERIQVNRQLISRDELVAEVAALRPVFDQFNPAPYGLPTVFQVGFALALHFFARQSIDIAVLEVGLGGRYDSANVVTPLVSVITSISYDHMAILGDTLAKIAWEKAGIIKPGVPVVTVPQQPEAMAVIERVAQEVGAPLYVAGAAGVRGQRSGVRGQTVEALMYPVDALQDHPAHKTHHPTPNLPGAFQRENARLAAGAALLLRRSGLSLPDAVVEQGLATAHWPGRLEIVAGEPPVVLDGAHNGDSAQRLVAALRDLFPDRPVVLVLGMSHGHNVDHILAALVPAARAIVLTHSRHPRAITDLNDVAARVRTLLPDVAAVPLAFTPDVPEALEEARGLAQPADLICVTGSLFVVAAAREALGLAEGE